jgi:hypothetical protein
MLQELTQYYVPLNARAIGIKEDLLSSMMVKPRESVALFVINLQRAISELERMRGPYTLSEKVRMLEKGFTRTEEHALHALANNLQFYENQLDWTQMKNYVTTYDTSDLGIKILHPEPIKKTQINSKSVLEGEYRNAMLCFPLRGILQLARQQPTENDFHHRNSALLRGCVRQLINH